MKISFSSPTGIETVCGAEDNSDLGVITSLNNVEECGYKAWDGPVIREERCTAGMRVLKL